ncbi:MAG TPA: hypothetical protein PLL30_15830 [Candidatus Krumholzibacteria bacterium]|nr:hypothetical protein [Candidatus Krumholzibacteria bacterium]HPD73240.1 hypothetical protein [Candidatus Krumholzibacteria bacterium]HRY40202.1 hypothetical protein [Candidatus Krumholzibacteria bacterium]
MILVLVGAASLLAQVVLLRELGVACYGGEIIYVLGLAVWLVAGAIGAAWGRSRHAALAPTALVFAVLAVACLVLARGLRPLLGVTQGADLDLGWLVLGSVLVLAPAGGVAGALFRLAADRRLAEGGAGGRAYALECLGAAGGGVLASALPAVGAPAALGAAGASLAALGIAVSAGFAWRRAAAGCTLLVLLAVFAGPFDHALTRWTHPDLVLTCDTPRGRVTFEVTEGRTAVFQDDALVHGSEDPGGEELVHLAATQRDRFARVLVMGGWLENLEPQLAAYDPLETVRLEPDRGLVRLGARFLRDRAPATDLVFGDPRAWLRAADDRFDLVVSALPDPVSARANRFWTRGFVELCASRLAPGGILALRLRTSENLWTPRQGRRVASVDRALREVFADVQVLPGSATVLLASDLPLERDLDILCARFDRASPPARIASTAWLRWRWTGDRTAEATALLARTDVPANTDLLPVCFGDTLLWDLGRLLPGLGWRSVPRPARWLAPAVIVAAIAVLGLRRRQQVALALAIGYAGFASMVLTSVLLLHHQIRHGVLYRDLGLLLTLAMLGQAAGAWSGARLGNRRSGRWLLPGLLVLVSCWSFLTTVGLLLGSGLATTAIWIAGAGFATALVFAAACRGAESLGRIYAADLAGGSVGALLAALLLIPFSGLPAATVTVAALAFPAALAVWPLPGRAADSGSFAE